MKTISTLLLLLPFLCNSQDILQKEINSTVDLSIYSVVKFPDNGYLACGSASSIAQDSTFSVLVKLDPLLQVEWSRRLNILRKDYFRCITPLSDGNYLVGGTGRQEFAPQVGGSLYKVDATGNIIWNRLYAKNYDDLTLGVFEQPDHTLVLFIRHGVSGAPTKIIKTDSSGTLLGQFTISKVNPALGLMADCVAEDGAGNYYMAGSSISSVTGNSIYFVARISNMALEWYREYDLGRDFAYLYGITVLNDENVAVTGTMADTISPYANFIGVMKVDPDDGGVIWAKEIRQALAYNGTGYNVLPMQNGGMLVIGQQNTANGFQAMAANMDADGGITWAREYGSGPFNIFSFGAILDDSRMVFGGKNLIGGGTYLALADATGFTPCNTDMLSLTSNEIPVTVNSPVTETGNPEVEAQSPTCEDVMLNLSENIFCSGTVSVEEPEHPPLSFNIYPNPANQYISIELQADEPTGSWIKIYSVRGDLVYGSPIEGQRHQIQIEFTPGLYFLSLIDKHGNTSEQRKLIIK